MNQERLNLARKVRLYCCLLVTLLTLAAAVTAQETKDALTNEAVVQMVQAHLSVELIVREIRTSPTNFSLDYKSLINLKRQGVPEAVILAMQTRSASTTSQVPANNGMASESQKVAQRTLTNDSIVQMVREHLNDFVIIRKIRTSPVNFSLDHGGEIKMRELGVSQRIIMAMYSRMMQLSSSKEPKLPASKGHEEEKRNEIPMQEVSNLGSGPVSVATTEPAKDSYAWKVDDVLGNL